MFLVDYEAIMEERKRIADEEERKRKEYELKVNSYFWCKLHSSNRTSHNILHNQGNIANNIALIWRNHFLDKE